MKKIKGDIEWTIPKRKKPIAYSTTATSDIIVALAQIYDTILEVYHAIMYDKDGKEIMKKYIDYGYGNEIAREWFKWGIMARIYTICNEQTIKQTESEIASLTEKIRLATSKAEIANLRHERARLKKRVYLYNYRLSKGEKNYSASLSMQMFGKRRRELTAEELREYNKILQQESRKRRKEQSKWLTFKLITKTESK